MNFQNLQSKPQPRRIVRGFTLIEIMIVVGIIGILLAIAIPGWIRQRTVTQARVCQQQLRSVDQAKEMYMLANNLGYGIAVTWEDLVPADHTRAYLKSIPVCPGGGEYSINKLGEFPTCSLGATVILDGSDAMQHYIVGINSPTGS